MYPNVSILMFHCCTIFTLHNMPALHGYPLGDNCARHPLGPSVYHLQAVKPGSTRLHSSLGFIRLRLNWGVFGVFSLGCVQTIYAARDIGPHLPHQIHTSARVKKTTDIS
jgi:hypothetical protein